MAVQRRLATVGISEQTAKGSPSTSAAYKHGITEGRVVGVEWEEESLPVTWDTRVHADRERLGITPMAEFGAVALSQSVGQWLSLLLGNVATSGTAPFTHDFTVADALPYLTLFGQFGQEFYEVQDGKISELTFEWERAGALRMSIVVMGSTLVFDGTTAFTANAEERTTDGYYRGQGGSLSVDGQSDLRIVSGSITFSNSASALFANDVLPDDIFEGVLAANVSLTAQPDDVNEWRKFLTGSDAGSDVLAEPHTGALNLQFGSTADAGHSLTFDMPACAFTAEFPGADPAGGAAELAVEAIALGDTNSEALTVTLVNDVADYAAV